MWYEFICEVKDLFGIIELPLLGIPYDPFTERIAPEQIVIGT
jgi:hypothetical protein